MERSSEKISELRSALQFWVWRDRGQGSRSTPKNGALDPGPATRTLFYVRVGPNKTLTAPTKSYMGHPNDFVGTED
jgi:hypothetical protein